MWGRVELPHPLTHWVPMGLPPLLSAGCQTRCMREEERREWGVGRGEREDGRGKRGVKRGYWDEGNWEQGNGKRGVVRRE